MIIFFVPTIIRGTTTTTAARTTLGLSRFAARFAIFLLVFLVAFAFGPFFGGFVFASLGLSTTTAPSLGNLVVLVVFCLETVSTFLFSSSLVVFVIFAGDQDHTTESTTTLLDAVLVAETVGEQEEEDASDEKEPGSDANGALEARVVVGQRWIPSFGGRVECVGLDLLLPVGVGTAIGVEFDIAGPRVGEQLFDGFRLSTDPSIASIDEVASCVDARVVVAELVLDLVKVISIAVFVSKGGDSELSTDRATQRTGGTVPIVVTGSTALSDSPNDLIVIEQAVGVAITQCSQEDIGGVVGEEGINVVALAAPHQGDRNPVLGDAIQGVGRVGAEFLDTVLVPVFIAISPFSIVIVVIDCAFTPTVCIGIKINIGINIGIALVLV